MPADLIQWDTMTEFLTDEPFAATVPDWIISTTGTVLGMTGIKVFLWACLDYRVRADAWGRETTSLPILTALNIRGIIRLGESSVKENLLLVGKFLPIIEDPKREWARGSVSKPRALELPLSSFMLSVLYFVVKQELQSFRRKLSPEFSHDAEARICFLVIPRQAGNSSITKLLHRRKGEVGKIPFG